MQRRMGHSVPGFDERHTLYLFRGTIAVFSAARLERPRIMVTIEAAPTILVIDDDALIGRALKRLAERTFPTFQVLWATNGVHGLELARQHAAQLRLIVLDVQMPLLNGHLLAVQLRTLVPKVPVMPCTSYEAMLPALLELGCVQPVIKHPRLIDELPERMRQAMAAVVPPLPSQAWVAALRQSGDTVLGFVDGLGPGSFAAPNQGAAAQVKKALDLLAKYCARFPRPAREVILARKALEEVTR